MRKCWIKAAGTIDWDDFRFVLAIVRGGSVSAAAKQLAVDHATVIRRVDRLERHLSAKLFDRRKTGYLLTEAGQRVADSAEAMESTIVANQEAVGGSRAHLTGTVRIGAPDGFGSHFLASRLVKFTERYPDLDLQLVATARLFSLSKREADIAISLTMPKEGRIVGRKLLDYSLGLYAAPAYLDRVAEDRLARRPARRIASSATSRNCCSRRNWTICRRSRQRSRPNSAAPI